MTRRKALKNIFSSGVAISLLWKTKNTLAMSAPDFISYQYPAGSYYCSMCMQYVYNPVNGEPDEEIEPGTSFADIPDSFYCPVCGSPKDLFHKL